MASLAALLLLAALPALTPHFGSLGAGDEGDPRRDAAPPVDRDELVLRLRDLMRTGIAKPTPSMSFVRRLATAQGAVPSLFDGSYDWHSCVFAHWSLLVIARTTGDEELSVELAAKLTPTALARELGYLEQVDPRLRATDPYDRAWLLRLLAELERHGSANRAALGELRARLEAELLDWLEHRPFPENPTRDPQVLGGRPFVGYYQSWLFTWIQLRLAGPTCADAATRLEAQRVERILPQRSAVAAHTDYSDYDFLWLPSLQVLVEELSPAGLAPIPFEVGSPIPIPERLTTANVHPLGLEVTRLWALGALAARGDGAAAADFDRRLAGIVARPELWSEGFEAVTHWVPQFLFVACWMRDGRP
ncbi:DUF2891 family protein [Engelhardtia mirabilis]|uniref:DUF2891 domain-containing protein n=1 Tax=Engelhardtia mirabilis TaxID=2528011 RepID=A0A518BGJ2_9BACT|nr:hypothetical protein Pla133_11090 [Planctomycetes bacterium Pla133]QDV00370.1 hypothetical protein Pla86_11090 [Planctomycetes bacterium Pla86]